MASDVKEELQELMVMWNRHFIMQEVLILKRIT